MNLSTEDAETKKLQCPSCGAPIEIVSELDTALQSGPGQGSAPEQAAQAAKPGKRSGCLIAVAVLLVIMAISFIAERVFSFNTQTGAHSDTLYLVRTGIESFRVADEGEAASKTLVWDEEEDSYRDPEADCWVWYNDEVDPPLWQYWYEGISSDYGDYGWMEHDDSGWYIEASAGEWVEVPSEYDLSGLWYFD